MPIEKGQITVVIPTFNEEEAKGLVLDEVGAAGYENVLVVDGYSVDGTVKVAESRRDLSTIVVSNATAIIHLSRIGKLRLLKGLFSKVVVPRVVYSEVVVPGEVGYEEVTTGFQEGWIVVEDVHDRGSVYELAPLLHRGEAEAIVLAEEIRADYLIVDERVARRLAVLRGIRVIGVLGILSLSVEVGLISADEALRLGEALIESGYIIDREVYGEWRRSLVER